MHANAGNDTRRGGGVGTAGGEGRLCNSRHIGRVTAATAVAAAVQGGGDFFQRRVAIL